MTVSTKYETINKEIYIANDGMSFNSEEECKAHERDDIENWCFENIEMCEDAEGIPMPDGEEHMDYWSKYWFRPQSEQEIAMLKAAFECSRNFPIKSDYIGKWICIEVGSDDAWCSCIDDGISHFVDLLDMLGYCVSIEEDSSNE